MDTPKEFGIQEEGIEYKERTGSYGVAIADGRILIEIGKLGYFLPGGGIDEGETTEEALQREFLEETGYELLSWKSLKSASEYFYDSQRKFYKKKTGHFFLVQLGTKSEPTYPDGHVRPVEWIALDAVQEKMHLESQWWAIEQALKL